MNVCPSGSAADVCILWCCFTHTQSHTHSGLLFVWRQRLPSSLSLSLGQSLTLTHSLWGREEECVIGGAVGKRLFTQCMLGVGQSKGAPSYTSLLYFFLSSFSLSHPRTFLSSFSGSKRDVCAGAWLCAVGCEWGCPLTKQKFITGGKWLKTIQLDLESISWIPAFKNI